MSYVSITRPSLHCRNEKYRFFEKYQTSESYTILYRSYPARRAGLELWQLVVVTILELRDIKRSCADRHRQSVRSGFFGVPDRKIRYYQFDSIEAKLGLPPIGEPKYSRNIVIAQGLPCIFLESILISNEYYASGFKSTLVCQNRIEQHLYSAEQQ